MKRYKTEVTAEDETTALLADCKVTCGKCGKELSYDKFYRCSCAITQTPSRVAGTLPPLVGHCCPHGYVSPGCTVCHGHIPHCGNCGAYTPKTPSTGKCSKLGWESIRISVCDGWRPNVALSVKGGDE